MLWQLVKDILRKHTLKRVCAFAVFADLIQYVQSEFQNF